MDEGQFERIKQLLIEIQGSVERIELKQREQGLELATLRKQLAQVLRKPKPKRHVDQIKTGTVFRHDYIPAWRRRRLG